MKPPDLAIWGDVPRRATRCVQVKLGLRSLPNDAVGCVEEAAGLKLSISDLRSAMLQ